MPKAISERGAKPNRARSQKVGRLARVSAMAESVWQDEAAGRRFLNTPHPEVGGLTPVEVAATEVGACQVEEVIERGRHGLSV